jgi:hypothetical protein
MLAMEVKPVRQFSGRSGITALLLMVSPEELLYLGCGVDG